MLNVGDIDFALMSNPGPDDRWHILPVTDVHITLLAPKGRWPGRRISPGDFRRTKILIAEENVHPKYIETVKRKLEPYDIEWVHPAEAEIISRPRAVKVTGIPSFWFDDGSLEYDLNDDQLQLYELPVPLSWELTLVRKATRSQKAAKTFWDFAQKFLKDRSAG
jgi:hypothetical protein